MHYTWHKCAIVALKIGYISKMSLSVAFCEEIKKVFVLCKVDYGQLVTDLTDNVSGPNCISF